MIPTDASPFSEPSAFLVVDLDRFQGPLDLLLHLIRTQDIDVFDIPISKITVQFLEAIKRIKASDLDNAGEFLEMAASLVRIKAQMLLPRHGDEEDFDPRAELVRRLLEYEQIREISNRLQRAETERSRRFPRGYVPPRPRPRLEDTPLETRWDEVFEAALGVELPEPVDHRHRVTTRPVAMEDKVHLILNRITSAAGIEFSKLLHGIEGIQAKMHGVMTLLASLELTRRRRVFLRQVSPFSELWLYRREEGDEDQLPIAPDHPEEPGQGDFEFDERPEAGVGADASADGTGSEPADSGEHTREQQ